MNDDYAILFDAGTQTWAVISKGWYDGYWHVVQGGLEQRVATLVLAGYEAQRSHA